MYCKNCGKLLDEGDKFCSGCGTKVEVKAFDDLTTAFGTPGETPKEKPKKKFHIEEFNWDLDGYPTSRKKTEDIDFNWESVLEEKQRRAFDQSLSEEEPKAAGGAEPKADAPSLEEEIFADLEKIVPEEPTKVFGQTAKGERIDKFYTFNKKNEAFQAILDQEYERIKNGEESQLGEEGPSFATDDGISKEAVLDQLLEDAAIEPVIEPVSREVEPLATISEEAPESNLIGVMWAETPECVIAADEAGEEQKIQLPKAPAAKIPSCPPSEGGKKEEQEPEHKLTFDDVFGPDDNDGDEKPEKKGKALKVIAIILCILVALELAMIGIQYFAPESAPAKMINRGYRYVTELFRGKDDEKDKVAQPDSDISEIAALIKANKDKNQNIAEIEEDQKLVFKDKEDYGFEEFGNSITFVDTSWYTEDDKTITYGDAIIGTLIQYYSSWVDKINGKNDKVLEFVEDTSDFYAEVDSIEPEDGVEFGINKLSIGEIRSGGAGFYALTSITRVSSSTKKETVENHIVYLEPDKKIMKIVEIKTI